METGLLGRRAGPNLLNDEPHSVAVRGLGAAIDSQVIATRVLGVARCPRDQRLLVGSGVVGQIA